MSVAYYIVLDNEEPGFDTIVDGKALAHEKKLDSLCEKLGLKTFEDFLTMSADDISDMLGEDIELPEGEGEKWFSPDEGLEFFSALAAHIRANPQSVKNAAGCLEDLAQYAEVLTKAKGIGAKWHLNLDI
jgi:hypothetical protein